MSTLTLLRRFIVGRRVFILSHLQFKRIILTGQMAMVVFITATGYLVFDVAQGFYLSWPFLAICSTLALISFIFNRRGHHRQAKILLVVAVNFTVYLFAASENIHTLDAFFLTIAIATIAGFGYEDRKLALTFVTITLVLYFISVYINFKPIPDLIYDAGYARNSKMINFVAALGAGAFIVSALIALNFHSEKALRESEQQLIGKNEELTRVNVELDRVVYSSTHDLTAPLRSILGLINLSNVTEDREELKKYLAMMKDRVTELDKFIKEMSDYKKNATSEVTYVDVPLNRLTREVLETLQFYPHAERLSIDINIDDDLTVCTDHTRMKVILSNIISNCFKYCDLEKKEPFVRIMAGQKNDFVHLQISDNGLGINEEALPKIFDMFYRAHNHSEGTGLGLYIVKEAIDKLGGTIAVNSAVGSGTTFNITLPTNLTKYKKT
ncbi:MAG TPA: HAMP domain-containing sensor histidine kinase [Cyclobacteriaceae bacterium]